MFILSATKTDLPSCNSNGFCIFIFI